MRLERAAPPPIASRCCCLRPHPPPLSPPPLVARSSSARLLVEQGAARVYSAVARAARSSCAAVSATTTFSNRVTKPRLRKRGSCMIVSSSWRNGPRCAMASELARATCASNSARVAPKRSIRARASPTVPASASTSADAFAAAPSWTSSSGRRRPCSRLQPAGAPQHAEHAPLDLPARRRRRRARRLDADAAALSASAAADGQHLRLRAERRGVVATYSRTRSGSSAGSRSALLDEDDRLAPLGD